MRACVCVHLCVCDAYEGISYDKISLLVSISHMTSGATPPPISIAVFLLNG